jgi:hypothetical protein
MVGVVRERTSAVTHRIAVVSFAKSKRTGNVMLTDLSWMA